MPTVAETDQPTIFHPRPFKRRRLSSATTLVSENECYNYECSNPMLEHVDSVDSVDSATANPRACLEALPAELLNLILDFSFEASLIHVSRQLRAKLPPFVTFTQRLAFQSLLPLIQWKETGPIECCRGSEIARWLACLDPDTQNIIREKTFATYWLSEELIDLVRQTLLNWTILKTCAVYFERPPSRLQMGRIRAFVDKQRTPVIGAKLNVRLTSENKRVVHITATPFKVAVSERSRSFYQALEFPVVDFGNAIPDFLLRHPLTSYKQAMISDICKWIARKHCDIMCNLELLADLILHCINTDQLASFYELLRLAALTKVVLGIGHVERVVTLGRWRMLTPLLKHTWRYRSLYQLFDTDLVRLIDQAKINEYPNSNDTTRILAMEIAALWKMAEVEGAGGSVSRIYTQWPPCLSIRMAGEETAKIWYIPKDPRHEVDWESSEFWGWIQRRMYTHN